MHRVFERHLLGVLMGAVACIAVALTGMAADDAAPLPLKTDPGRGQTASTPGSTVQPSTDPSRSAADTDNTPTLAPARRNTLRDASKSDAALPETSGSPLRKAGSGAGDTMKLLDRASTGPRASLRDLRAEESRPPVAAPLDASASPAAPSKPPVATAPPDAGIAGKAPLPGDTALKPVPETAPGPAEIETASFSGVTPGVSTVQDVEKVWGKPKEVRSPNEALAHLYKVDPFENVEVIFQDGKVASIVIRLDRSFPANAVAEQLALSNIHAVLVSNDLGEILGQCFPERGVSFSFEPSPTPGKATMKVSQIILEPVTAEPFLLCAETNLDTQSQASLHDLEHALKLAPDNARAHWLQARLLILLADPAKALSAADAAVRLEPKDAQFLLTRAQILGQVGQFAEAIASTEQAIAASGDRVHIKARAQCLMGDLLGSGPQPDYKKAIEHHVQAIKTADALASSPHPAIRLPAKEVLIDAHLGAAHDIAWGNWNQKQTAVNTWLKRASAFAEDLIASDGGTTEHRFRVATRALAACVGAQGKVDPSPWNEQVLSLGPGLLKAAGDTAQKQQIQWELGMALYDAVQIHQMRGEREPALKYGQKAIEYLEASGGKDVAADAYLLGRLYFRLGSIHAIGKQDHRAAVSWFEKAAPMLEKAGGQVAPHELGRLGETFVSMGVSYWETGKRDRAVKLTQHGVELMEKAVKEGQIPQTALDVPYANLATMHRHLGQDAEAEKYLDRSSAKRSTPVRR